MIWYNFKHGRAACIFLSQTRRIEEACKSVFLLNRKIKRIYATPIVYYTHYGWTHNGAAKAAAIIC